MFISKCQDFTSDEELLAKKYAFPRLHRMVNVSHSMYITWAQEEINKLLTRDKRERITFPLLDQPSKSKMEIRPMTLQEIKEGRAKRDGVYRFRGAGNGLYIPAGKNKHQSVVAINATTNGDETMYHNYIHEFLHHGFRSGPWWPAADETKIRWETAQVAKRVNARWTSLLQLLHVRNDISNLADLQASIKKLCISDIPKTYVRGRTKLGLHPALKGLCGD
tara:strand:- start:605 stop:1267 length:663 start_codon:yes stop_codon:yes gene_type:complete